MATIAVPMRRQTQPEMAIAITTPTVITAAVMMSISSSPLSVSSAR